MGLEFTPLSFHQYGFPTWGRRTSKNAAALFLFPTPQGNRQTPVVDSALFGSAVNCQVPLYLSLRCICQSVTTRETWNWEVHSLGPPFQGLGPYPSHCLLWSQISSHVKQRKWVLSSLILPFIQFYPLLLEFSLSQKKNQFGLSDDITKYAWARLRVYPP